MTLNSNSRRLAGKVAIVTGGGAGFGEGIVRAFVAEGAKVLIADLDEAAANRVASECAENAYALRADVSCAQDNQRMVEEAERVFGGLDIFVANAGTTHRNKSLLEVSEEDFDRITNVNMKAIYHGVRAAIPAFERRGGGTILATASTAGLRPRPGLVWYNASKAWVINACKCMAVELAPKNIRVNCLCPVAGETQMLADFMGGDDEQRRAAFRASVPLGRFCEPADMGNAALYLASEEASFITGVALEVDGGRCV